MKKVVTSVYTLCILLWVYCAILFPKRRVLTPSTIFISQMAKLGDMVCTTPLFRAVKVRYPNVRLVVMGSAINREVLAGNPYVDMYEVPSPRFTELLRQIRSVAPDYACTTAPNFEFTAACLIARVPIVVVPHIVGGWSPYERLPYKMLKPFVVTKAHRMGSYAPREYLKLLEPLGIYTHDTRKEVFFTKGGLEHVELVLNKSTRTGKGMLIGILPGAGNEIKSWAPEKFAELMNMIGGAHAATFVLLGTKKDEQRARVIKEKIHADIQYLDCINQFSIDELKAVISTLTMLIGADTGPQYIAEALGIPTIDIVGPVDEREQPPTGPLHRIVKANRTKPQLYVMNARHYDDKEARRQIADISPEMVYAEFCALHAQIYEHHS